MAITASGENFNFTPFRPRESPQHYIKKLFGKPISHTLHNDSTPTATKVEHFMFKKAERQPSTPTEPLFTLHTEEQGKLKNKSAERGRMWATDEQWRGPAERMGAARATSSADSSHGCGSKSCNSCARAGHSLLPTSLQLLHLQTILQTPNGPFRPQQLHVRVFIIEA